MAEPTERMEKLFFEVFEPLPRQGPGSRSSAKRALDLCAGLPPSPIVLLFARALARRRPELGVVATHPGFTATELQRHSFRFRLFRLLIAQSVEAGALSNIRAAVDPGLSTLKETEWVGPKGRGEMKGPPSVLATVPSYANNVGAQDALWKLSEQLTGVSLQT